MNMKSPRMLFVITALCWINSFSVMAIAQEAPKGFNQMVETIGSKPISELSGRKFDLTVDRPGSWDLKLKPADGFDIKKLASNRFEVTIIDVQKLVDTSTGISLPVAITYELTLVGVHDWDIGLGGQAGTVYPISFSQKTGDPVDFDVVKEAWKIDFLYDQSMVEHIHTSRYAAVFKRHKSGPAYVRLKLTRPDREVISDAVPIPDYSNPESPDAPVLMERRPGECVLMGGYSTEFKKQDVYFNGKIYNVHLLDYSQQYINTSEKYIRCFHVYDFISYDDNREIHRVSKTYNFIIPPRQFYTVSGQKLFNDNMEILSRYETINTSLTKEVLPSHITGSNSFVCTWTTKADYLNGQAWELVSDRSKRNGREALRLALEAIALEPDAYYIADTLACAYAETGNFQKAIETQQRASALAKDNEDRQRCQKLINAYRNRMTYLEYMERYGKP